jgi:hypothetical protein
MTLRRGKDLAYLHDHNVMTLAAGVSQSPKSDNSEQRFHIYK